MNRTQFDASMRQILSFYSRPRNQEEQRDYEQYMNALYESVGAMDPFLFDQTTKELVKTLSRGQKPMPGQFWAVYHKLSTERAEAAERQGSGKEWREDKETCDLRAIEMASRLGRKGAEFSLLLIDSSTKFKYVRPDALQILMDKISEPAREQMDAPSPAPVDGSPAQEVYEIEE